MMKNLLLSLTMLCFASALMGQTSLQGKVIDSDTKEAILFGSVALYKNGNLITGTQTDLDGNYVFSNIDPGTYDVEASYVGYQSARVAGVQVFAGKSNKADIEIGTGGGVVIDEVVVTAYKVPLIEQDNTTQGGIVTAETIRNLPTKSINALAATTAGIASTDGGAVNVRGSRSNATNYYIDGIRVSGNQVPASEIDQLQVITGGIEAKYGDVTGGIISVTTKGPSSRFSGGFEAETSEGLDPYGYNLLSANLSGPILKKKTGESIIGFRFSGQYTTRADGARAFGVYQATEDAIRRIEENPIITVDGITINAAERLTAEDVVLNKARENVGSKALNMTGKIDFRISNEIDLTFSGSYDNSSGRGNSGNLLNWQNNSYSKGEGYRVNARFRHRLGGGGNSADGEAKPSLIRNAAYTLQFGYQFNTGENGDERYGEDFFKYGYVGNFDVEWNPIANVVTDSSAGAIRLEPGLPFFGIHTGFNEQYNGYTRSPDINTVLNNYNNGIGDVGDFRDLNVYNGFRSSVFTNVYGLHSNVGRVNNGFGRSETERYTFDVQSSFDLFPGRSDKGRHNIQFGVQYEQRVGSSWNVSPNGLWTLARLQANNQHIIGIDSTMTRGDSTDLDFAFMGMNGTYRVPVYENLIQDQPTLLFYKEVRKLTGDDLRDYVNIDALNPEDLTLSMFAPQELSDRGLVGYAGYDYVGNKLKGNYSFDDFFTDFDPVTGLRNFTVAPNRPIYAAAFIQDKFTFKDIIFRLGVRVERYDANTKVLKDPYTLYDILGANDFYDLPDVEGNRPGTIGDDYKVYVEGENSTTVRAFRDGDQWYDAEGTPVNDGNLIFGQEIVFPYYAQQDGSLRNIRAREFDIDGTFEDYEPQINWTPRMAFSFPISDEANFFMHYDILVQRPPSNTFASARSYYYFEEAPPSNNPNLRPEKTIDYEMGFKQKISNSSALTITAYYKGLQDMIQSRQYLNIPSPVNSYESFGNLDFGTVKGFSFSYDLRRTANFQMTASYTLQFADGTGSNSTSQRALNNRGNIRVLSPLSFDERHRLVANMDYRYGSGKKYNGPRWFGADVFSNAGVGMQFSAVSGRPYTSTTQPTQFGGTGIAGAINGARLPWNMTVDLRADKSFRIFSGGDEGKRPLYLNVYLRVQNLLDTRNVIGVYSASNSAEDDGFLASPLGSARVTTLESTGRAGDVPNFLQSYQWRLLNPGFFTLPRRMYVGAVIEF